MKSRIALFLACFAFSAACTQFVFALSFSTQDPFSVVDCGDGNFKPEGECAVSDLAGYGTASTFGGTSNVVTVTNTNDSGAGSLRQAIADHVNGTPMLIEFSTGGTINLVTPLTLQRSHLTIDGLTAPSPGITLDTAVSGDGIVINAFMDGTGAHDVRLQGLAIVGDWDRDSVAGSADDQALVIDCDNNNGPLVDVNIVLRRLTMVDVGDSAGDVFSHCDGVTISESIFAYNYHPVSLGAAGTETRERISMFNNVFYSNEERSPQIRGDVRDFEMINNVIAGSGLYGTRIRDRDGTNGARMNFINNAWLDYTPPLIDIVTSYTPANAFDINGLADPANCYESGNSKPAAATDACTAGSEFARADATLAPTRVALTALSGTMIGSTSSPNIGAPFPTTEIQNVLAEVKTQLETEFPLAVSSAPTFWEEQPARRCDALVTAGNTCGDGTLFCPTTLAEVETMHDDAAFGAGDALCLRGGTYSYTTSSLTQAAIELTKDGTGDGDAQRLTLGNYPGETITIVGLGDEATWDDATFQRPSVGERQVGIAALGDYWRIEGDPGRFRCEWMSTACVVHNGDYVDVFGLSLRYTWSLSGASMGTADPNWATDDTASPTSASTDGRQDVMRPRQKWNDVAYTYHGTPVGVHISRSTIIDVIDGVIEYNIIAHGGYEPDGDQVQVIPGDPGAGGNSDIIAMSVDCLEQADAGAECHNITIRRNFGYQAADDCVDAQGDGVYIYENWMQGCGPSGNKGVKQKSAGPHFNLFANILLDGNAPHAGSQGRGLETRSTASANERTYFHHNVAAYWDQDVNDKGIIHEGSSTPITGENVSLANATNYFGTQDATDLSLTSGDAATYFEGAVDATAFSLTTVVDSTSKTRTEMLWEAAGPIIEAYEPAAGSPLIDAGDDTLTDSNGDRIFCALAYDNGQDQTDHTCAQWIGSEPDRGAIERGLY